MKILFIDACTRRESRTRRLANVLLDCLPGEVERLNLYEIPLPDINEEAVNKRATDAQSGDFSDEIYSLAQQFASADEVVVAAPYWDFSFPSVLKKYIETITVSGITFFYSADGVPVGLCNAKRMFYVTTAGGPIFNNDFGYGYIKTMANIMYGIPECYLFSAENLDIDGADVESILQKAEQKIKKQLKKIGVIL